MLQAWVGALVRVLVARVALLPASVARVALLRAWAGAWVRAWTASVARVAATLPQQRVALLRAWEERVAPQWA